MQGSYKVCPQCGQAAALDAQQCSQCGRVYRTQFSAGMNQTQVVPNMNWTPSPQVPQQTIIDECSEQYHRLTLWRIISFLTMPGIIGIIMWFVLDSYDMNLRSKVAAQNMSADYWESLVRPRRMRTFRRFWGGLFAFAGVIVLLVFTAGYLEQREQAERAQAKILADEQEQQTYAASIEPIQSTPPPGLPAYNPPDRYQSGPYGGTRPIPQTTRRSVKPGSAAILKANIQSGMSADQVRRFIGMPDTIESSNGQDYWYYRREDGALIIKYENDHVSEFGVHGYGR